MNNQYRTGFIDILYIDDVKRCKLCEKELPIDDQTDHWPPEDCIIHLKDLIKTLISNHGECSK